LACQSCNLHKGTNLATIDPESNEMIRVFNPRTDIWEEHFQLVDFVVVGLTGVGRATARLLAMNTPHRVELRILRRIR
jgi:hypothetical protein